ncbi:MAG: zinc-dependent alcohol dehydrogenase [Coriobacteriales bacterium]|jgi:L-iditol 2-dehydrogenase
MKAAVLTRVFDPKTGTPGKVECMDWPDPKICEDDDVLIDIAYASICGSDKHYIKDNLFPEEPPYAVGHEWSGVIADLGPAAKEAGLAVGDRVTGDFMLECGTCFNCRTGKQQFCEHPVMTLGMQAEQVVLKAAQVFKIPDDVDLDVAAMTEPFAIAVNAILKSGLSAGMSVFVIGAGSIGQMLVQLARISGASLVATSARTAYKRDLALEMGADIAIDPTAQDVVQASLDATDGRGFDIVIEASGSAGCVSDALDIVTPGGKVLLVSYYDPEALVSIPVFKKIVQREVTLQGMQIGQQGWPYAIKMLSRVNLRPLISEVYDLEDVEKAYASHMKGDKLKILLKCS